MNRHNILALAVTLLLSCGFAHASSDPQHFAYVAPDHGYVVSGESMASKAARELALIQWQHDVAQASRVVRSDMHASGGGMVFTAIHGEPGVDGSQLA